MIKTLCYLTTLKRQTIIMKIRYSCSCLVLVYLMIFFQGIISIFILLYLKPKKLWWSRHYRCNSHHKHLQFTHFVSFDWRSCLPLYFIVGSVLGIKVVYIVILYHNYYYLIATFPIELNCCTHCWTNSMV